MNATPAVTSDFGRITRRFAACDALTAMSKMIGGRPAMSPQTAEIIHTAGSQAVKLPEGFHFAGDAVSIRRQGEAVILEPLKPTAWPPGFFDAIRIDDPAFERPAQGDVPAAPSLD